jgi:hypothetical protein
MAKAKRTKKRKAKKKKERGAAYLLKRLEKLNPKIYADFLAGRYASVNKACEAAGLKPRTSGLDALKRVWKRSPADDQDAFLILVKPPAAKIAPMTVGPIVDPSLCLSKEVRDFLACWIFYKSSKAGRIMQELGFPASDTSLSAAIKHDGPFRQEVIDMLEPWLTRNGFVPSMPGLGR